MKQLVSMLGAGLLALAGASAYLTWQLGIERSRAAQAEARIAGLESRLQTAERERAAAREAITKAADAAPDPVAAPGKEKNSSVPDGRNGPAPRVTWKEDSRQARLYQTPSSRALLRADRIARLKSQNPELARVLGLTEAEGDDLLAFLADQELSREMQAAQSRQNNVINFDFAKAMAEERRELAAKLGEERLQKYDAYRKGAPDRSQVRSFRMRLGDSDALTDAQAESLASALQEEREQYANEISNEIGAQATFSMGSATGRSFMTNIAPSDEDAQERQLNDQMETYTRRANDRAAGLLTPRQLKVFKELQAAQLTSDRLMIRSMRDTPPRK